MAEKKFFRLILSEVFEELEELVSAHCFEHGAEGVAEKLNFQQNPSDYSVETIPSAVHTLEVYFNEQPTADFFEGFKARWPQIKLELIEDHEQDWLAEWKKGFVPFSLVSGVWVVPSWLKPPPEAHKVIWMEPGMAFGTGTHETTKLAAQLLAKALAERPQARVLDVGTGTGILAILARHLGAREVVATEIDADARRVARENLALNHTSAVEISEQQIDELVGTFDVVVANIIDGVLIQLQRHLKRMVGPGGALVLSGIIDERESLFTEKFKPAPLAWGVRTEMNEWRGFLLEAVP